MLRFVNESNISQVRKLFYKQFNGSGSFVLRSFCYNEEKKGGQYGQ